jgi:hypothetical protein
MTRTTCGFGDMDDPRHSDGCLSCGAAIRRERRAEALRRGLPYGWWKDPDNVAMVVWFLCSIVLAVLILAWGVDWKAWW